jgi:hypothetical protein
MKKQPRKPQLNDILPKYTVEDMLEPDLEVRAEMGVINKSLDNLALKIGRPLTEEEQEAILNIVDLLSPKDENGDIILFASFDYAWQVYQKRPKTTQL